MVPELAKPRASGPTRAWRHVPARASGSAARHNRCVTPAFRAYGGGTPTVQLQGQRAIQVGQQRQGQESVRRVPHWHTKHRPRNQRPGNNDQVRSRAHVTARCVADPWRYCNMSVGGPPVHGGARDMEKRWGRCRASGGDTLLGICPLPWPPRSLPVAALAGVGGQDSVVRCAGPGYKEG